MFDNNSEYHRLISTIRAQCSRNENPPEPSEVTAKATTPIQLIKRKPYMNSRKISLTCPNVKVISKSLPDNQLLDPLMKRPSGRLRSPSPSPSPNSSPLPSPSRSRFQVSKVSESANKFTASASPSPSSSSGSPTFFPPHSRFRVTVIGQPTPSAPVNIVTQTNFPLNRESSILDHSKEIDIPKKVAPKEVPLATKPIPTSFLNISNSSMLSSQSCGQLDYEVKTFIDMDSCSSFSSSIESIDHQTDLSSTESFDFLDKIMPTIDGEDKRTRDILSNENTLISTSSSSSNEGLTLTTNSPTSSPKQEQKRVRKTSWIHSAIGSTGKNENIAYPATLDKLLNLFQHPTSLFTKTSPEPTVMTTSMSSTLSNKPKCTTQNRETAGVKENSISGLIHSFINLTHNKKDDSMTTKSGGGSCTILQNISPENTVGKATNSQMIIESLPKSVKKELKENISPENTISCDNIVGIETSVLKSQLTPKVLFLMGDSVDEQDCDKELQTTSDVILRQDSVSDDLIDLADPEQKSLGDIARDSLSILKLRDNDSNLKLSTDDSHLQNQTM